MHASVILALILLAPGQQSAAKAECTLHPTHGTPLLLGDVSQQTIELTAMGSCAALDGSVHLVNSTESNFRATSAVITKNPKSIVLTINSKIPAPSQGISVSGTWNLFSSEGAMSAGDEPLAQLRISPIVATTSATTETIFREAPPGESGLSRSDADRLTSIWKSQVNTIQTAFFTTSPTNTDIYNRATISIPDIGPIDPNGLRILGTTVQILDGSSLSVVNFAPNGSSADILVTATVARPSGESLTIELSLATSAQPVAIPLPISQIAYIKCPSTARLRWWDVIRHNQIAGVSNTSITNGRCELIISEDDINWSIAMEHGIPHRRYRCTPSRRTAASTQITEPRSAEPVNMITPNGEGEQIWEDGETRCTQASALAGEEVTLFRDDSNSRARANRIREHYGQQHATMFVFTEPSKREASAHKFIFDATRKGHMRVPIDFGESRPSADSPYHVEVTVQTARNNETPSPDLDQHPAQTYKSTLRPKGPFGYPHLGSSLGSRSVRVFATVPLDFTAIRFPAAGLDLQKTSDSTIAQISTLTTGLLLTAEPWDYARGTTMFVLPFRFQAGMLLSNWYKGVFHPSTFLGGSITLPLFRGTKQTDTDLALGAGWEVDLRSGYQDFGSRNHLLVTLGLNIFSLFGAQSAPK